MPRSSPSRYAQPRCYECRRFNQLSLFPTLPSRFHLLRSGRETRDKGDIDARCRPRIAIHCPLERDPYMSLRIRAFLGTR
jgi:hypothetical protein